ncbi:hypothetical protein [Catenovulum sediminis]|uniref:Uncharacterized protein n=1 Tax=Catenovulum sediminis TaxID=1740262 RepID=A0ABV1RL08_9ALTE|nr:hypothetical protein [Catenovulum sediminis]
MSSNARGIKLTTVAFAVLIMAVSAMFNSATADNSHGQQVVDEQPAK